MGMGWDRSFISNFGHIPAGHSSRNSGIAISHTSVAVLLNEMEYSLQANKKTKEGNDPPDRDQQFQYINQQAILFLRKHHPVISVDTKKKELIGNYKNAGREWEKKGEPVGVLGHD